MVGETTQRWRSWLFEPNRPPGFSASSWSPPVSTLPYRLHWRLGLSSEPHGSLNTSPLPGKTEWAWKCTAGGFPVDFQAAVAGTAVSLLIELAASKSPFAAAHPFTTTLSTIAAPRVPES